MLSFGAPGHPSGLHRGPGGLPDDHRGWSGPVPPPGRGRSSTLVSLTPAMWQRPSASASGESTVDAAGFSGAAPPRRDRAGLLPRGPRRSGGQRLPGDQPRCSPTPVPCGRAATPPPVRSSRGAAATRTTTTYRHDRLVRPGHPAPRPVCRPRSLGTWCRGVTDAHQSGLRRALSRQNSLPSGSTRTCHCSCPVWPMSAGRAPSFRRRSSSAS